VITAEKAGDVYCFSQERISWAQDAFATSCAGQTRAFTKPFTKSFAYNPWI